jgi:hypothetical protein
VKLRVKKRIVTVNLQFALPTLQFAMVRPSAGAASQKMEMEEKRL